MAQQQNVPSLRLLLSVCRGWRKTPRLSTCMHTVTSRDEDKAGLIQPNCSNEKVSLRIVVFLFFFTIIIIASVEMSE